jgi:hypothetical protein
MRWLYGRTVSCRADTAGLVSHLRPFRASGSADYDGAAMADDAQIPLAEQLEEIGAQLDWVRGYL